MRNTTTPEVSPTVNAAADATSADSRRRPTKGIDLPTTVCFTHRRTSDGFPHRGTGSDTAVLPDWAIEHLIDEYLPAGHSAILEETHRPANLQAGFPQRCPLSHRGYRRFGASDPTALVVIEGRPSARRAALLNRGEASAGGVRELLDILQQARLLLVKGGHVAVALERPTPGPGFIDVTSQVIDAARRAGFFYVQHLAVINADVTGDQITTPTDAAVLAEVASLQAQTRVHARVHHDVLVFTNFTRKGAA